MNAATAIDSARDSQVLRLTLPPGTAHSLCRVGPGHNGALSAEWEFRGRRLRVETAEDSGVLFPTDVGLSLLAALNHDPGIDVCGARVLDIGCGSGLYTVALLAAGAARVTALDVNPACVTTTADNVARNGLDIDRVETITGDLAVIPISRPWDLVVCNPPHLPHDPAYATADGIEAALVGGADGRAVYDVLLARLDELLAPGGVLVLAHSSLTDIPRTRRLLERAGYRCRTVQVCELDIPMRRYAAHRHVVLSRMYALRAAGRAAFRGLRFEVHTLAATRVPANGEKR